ncbi:MAG TPA: hemerythrin domain-containing protein [Terriglobia bacterium]|nr:hemerythrin domain-containing protein [Terriglobia bacterium]
MRAKRTRAAHKVTTEFSGVSRIPGKGKLDRSSQAPPSLRLVPAPPPRGASKARRSLEPSAATAPRHHDVSAWSEAPLSVLVSHIVSEHHRFTYRQLRRLERLLAQVVDQHAREYPQLIELQVSFLALSDNLTTHMIREEQMLFPYILQLEEAVEHGERLARPVFGSVRDPMDVLMVEHEGIKAALEKIRVAGDAYAVPLEGSAAWKALARGLKALEQNLHRHLQLEDTVLFPRAVSAENSDRYLVEV